MARVIEWFLVAMFAALYVTSPFLGSKIVVVAGMTFPAGAPLVAVSIGFLDILNDWKGRQAARDAVTVTLAVRIAIGLVVVPIILALPAKSVPPGYDAIVGFSIRLVFAGLCSIFVSSWVVNTTLFSWLRERMKGRYFALRYLVVSVPTILTSIAVTNIVGFWGTDQNVWGLISGSFVQRIVIGVAIVPFVWLGRTLLRRAYG